MAALVQSYPQQSSSTITMLQGQSSSSASPFSQQYSTARPQQLPRFTSSSSSGSYRGLTTSGLVAPYAFTSTPQLSNSNAGFTHNTIPANTTYNSSISSIPHFRFQNRTLSAPNLLAPSQSPLSGGSTLPTRPHPSDSPPASSSPRSSLQPSQISMDDASIGTRSASIEVPARPMSTIGLPSPGSSPSINSLAIKASPDRYRRGSRSPQTETNAPGSVNAGSNRVISPATSVTESSPVGTSPGQGQSMQRPGGPRTLSSDDLSLTKSPGSAELAQRYRRRSVGSLEAVSDWATPPAQTLPIHLSNTRRASETQDPKSSSEHQPRASFHSPKPSSDSSSSTRSIRVVGQQPSRRDPAQVASVTMAGPIHATSVSKQEVKLVNVPPRADPAKRLTNPSPLSKPSTLEDSRPERLPVPQPAPVPTLKATTPPTNSDSPAAQQLAAINKDGKKKSRLRRAFSFGAASELRRASVQNNVEKMAIPEPKSKPNSRYEDELDPEQAKIAQRQEAGGLGASIYSGQGNFFTGSTDNLSIQSSASSASVMLRKMGKGVKKSTRSIVGIFRPKSVIGVPAADGPVGGTAQVSMVTVEAEREKVNINLDPHDQAGGGTGFPKLELNSVDLALSADPSRGSNDTTSRRSIVGGEKERAEVLAAVKKGILKRTDSAQSSPSATPTYRAPDFNLPQIARVNDSPVSSEPTTPSDGAPPRSGHRRTDSLTIDGIDSDYFSSITQFAAGLDSPETVLTPNGSLSRNISFSPRIRFHDTWPSMEYDRRGDIATCNRLTPILAQQIKEELNSFKMEMEVHESSKVYTHFF